ncbi:MAG: DUF4407 domain-containing protein [Flavobacteriales bacterium]|nr:DUF4407 domain-containing protein [Flavobacteriales bacterium]
MLSQRSAAIWWAKWLITLLFIFVEIAPVLFKMMTERGPYDDIVEQKKYEVLLNQQVAALQGLNEDANATLKGEPPEQPGGIPSGRDAQEPGNAPVDRGGAEGDCRRSHQGVEGGAERKR